MARNLWGAASRSIRRVAETKGNMMKKILLAFLCLCAMGFAAVNINTASKDELATLKGIGAKKAEAIIDYRDKHGKFQNIDDLKKVNGIGEKLFESIKADIVTTDKKGK
ncbi:MAG: helix-hairpin-helix domain-containing protein [Helicobacter sp.]|nr:helix-hairpin-helix domain-containing protein [Helicobacter sp.]MBD5166481.1 helix-hairpin-helix domain-containing protein [Helicobacter sp.]MBD5167788.1 helix-hairpin-helix domain-containing protein [Helicobacter sp.]